MSRGALSRVWPEKLLSPLPSYLSSPSLSFSSFSYFTHLQPDDTTTKKCSLKLNCHGNILMARSQAPSLQNSFPSGVVSGHQPTCLHYITIPDSTTTEGPPVAEGLYRRRPTPLETQEKKRQRKKHTHHWLQFTRAQLQTIESRQNLDVNQSN